MKSVKLFSAIFIMVSSISCGESVTEIHDSKEVQSETIDNSQAEKTGLSLNDGAKWEANEATTVGVNNMIALVDAFTAAEDTAAFSMLSDTLQTEFTMIFQKCTMKGEAHNQLHSFLLPIRDALKGMSTGGIEERKEVFVELKKHLLVYEKFFV